MKLTRRSAGAASSSSVLSVPRTYSLFFFNDAATTEIYTLSLHDALPISPRPRRACLKNTPPRDSTMMATAIAANTGRDRKSTRLNSSHMSISYAVFCLKKKKLRALDVEHHVGMPDALPHPLLRSGARNLR